MIRSHSILITVQQKKALAASHKLTIISFQLHVIWSGRVICSHLFYSGYLQSRMLRQSGFIAIDVHHEKKNQCHSAPLNLTRARVKKIFSKWEKMSFSVAWAMANRELQSTVNKRQGCLLSFSPEVRMGQRGVFSACRNKQKVNTMGEEIPSVNIHSVAVTRGSWPPWATRRRGPHPNDALLTFIIPYETNSERVHTDPEGNDSAMESNDMAKVAFSAQNGASSPQNILNMQRRVSHGDASTDTLPPRIHSGFLRKAAFNIAIWLIRWFIPVFCINTEIHK